MLAAIRKRADRDEEGFTLIELMVVVLIIAILIAIAVPTFLGARQKAQARAAQSNVRNAFSAAKTFFTDNEKYSTDATTVATSLITELGNIEPSLTYNTAASTSSPKQIGVVVANTAGTVVVNGVVCLTAYGADGNYYTLRDISVGTNAGVSYFKSATAAGTCDTSAVNDGSATAYHTKW
jgi:type IV pilus assembly protein PilA